METSDESARRLNQCLYELDGPLFTAYSTNEPAPLIAYLDRLASSLGSAVAALRLRDEADRDLALNRVLLFVAAKNVMAEMFEILGAQPLTRI